MAFRKASALAFAGTVAVLAAGAATSASAAPTTTAAPAATAATCHASSGNLYCGNRTNASGNPIEIVDTLRSGFSYFKCYTIGQPHGGGNSIWYRTYGDDTGAWGYVPAVDVYTPTDPFPGVNFC